MVASKVALQSHVVAETASTYLLGERRGEGVAFVWARQRGPIHDRFHDASTSALQTRPTHTHTQLDATLWELFALSGTACGDKSVWRSLGVTARPCSQDRLLMLQHLQEEADLRQLQIWRQSLSRRQLCRRRLRSQLQRWQDRRYIGSEGVSAGRSRNVWSSPGFFVMNCCHARDCACLIVGVMERGP